MYMKNSSSVISSHGGVIKRPALSAASSKAGMAALSGALCYFCVNAVTWLHLRIGVGKKLLAADLMICW
jgi:hypothetical protein